MRELMYKNQMSKKNHRRVIAISETTVKKGFLTQTRKKFIYIVRPKSNRIAETGKPDFFITKVFDTKKGTERVLFRIKGVMEVMKEETPVLVHYCHSLKIDIKKLDTKATINNTAS